MEAVECRYRGRVIGWIGPGPDGNLRYIRCNSKGSSSAAIAVVKFHEWAIQWRGIENVDHRLRMLPHD